MDSTKQRELTAAGWRVGDAAEFLELSPAESAFIELKLSLANRLREARLQLDLSQAQVARRLGSSQSRVAKMEAADASVSLDLLVKALLTLGVSRCELGEAVGRAA